MSFIDTATRWQPVQILDPGPDNRRGTADDAGLITVFNNSNPGEAFRVMTNPPQAYRRYRAAQLVASRRHANGWGFQASYTWSRTVGNYHNGFSSNAANNDNSINGVFVNPNRAINSEGRTPQDVPHALKVFGSVRLPWLSGWTASGSYRYQTGPRWSRLVVFTSGLQQGFEFVRVEPLTRTTPALHTADLRLEKNLQIQALSFGLFADVFNVTNAGTPRGYVHASGPRFGLPQAWIDPRTLRVGLRAAF